MPASWHHPNLGEFVADDCGWSTKLRIPEFEAFSYDTGYRNARRPCDPYPFSIRWLGGKRPGAPTPEMAAVAENAIARPDEIVRVIAEALWEAFNGRGLLPAAWWHGGIDVVNKALKGESRAPLCGPGDIPATLVLSSITVWDEVYDHPAPIAVYNFGAPFETEHGVYTLTDGRPIVGAGVGDDADPIGSRVIRK